MSLINDALKKAQKMRQAGPAEPPPPEAAPPAAEPVAAPQPVALPPRATTNEVRPPARITKRRQPVSANKVVGAIALIIGGFSLLAASAVYLFIPRDNAPELNPRPAAVARPLAGAPVAAPVITPAPVSPTPMVNAPQATAPAANAEPPEVRINLGPTSPTSPPHSPPPSASLPAVPAVPPPLPANPISLPAVASVPAPSPRLPNPAISALVEQFRVSGVRPSPTDPRILMNGSVFQIGDVVDRSSNLRLIRVEDRRLTFEDAAGFRYVKNF